MVFAGIVGGTMPNFGDTRKLRKKGACGGDERVWGEVGGLSLCRKNAPAQHLTHYDIFYCSHRAISETCLTYLNSRKIRP